MEEEFEAGIVKKFMYVNRKAPFGTIYALEVLEMVLISAAFDQDVHVAFLDDGVYELKKGFNPSVAGMKNFSNTYRALDGYDIEKIFVEKESLEERGIAAEDLVIEAEVLSRADMSALMSGMDVILTA